MVLTGRSYTMLDALAAAKTAAEHIENYLLALPATVRVVNVENDPGHQDKDIDLLWTYRSGAGEKTLSIEIKGDKQHATGNFFLETISNAQKNTPGCFMYSEADYLFYYFIGIELYIIPMKAAREWFVAEMNRFRERKTTTPVGTDGEHYNTVGRLVPREILLNEVAGVRWRPFRDGRIVKSNAPTNNS